MGEIRASMGVAISVVVNHVGALDLNGIGDTISALTINGGTVVTGAGTLTESGALSSAPVTKRERNVFSQTPK